MRRYGLRDDQWDRIKDFLPGREGHSRETFSPAFTSPALSSFLTEHRP